MRAPKQETNFSEIKRHLRECYKHVEACSQAARRFESSLLGAQIEKLKNQINDLFDIVESAGHVVIQFPPAGRAN
jgi:hypothetical protein